MVMTLETIFEPDCSGDSLACTAKKGNIEIISCKAFDDLHGIPLLKQIDPTFYGCQSGKELELCEPESELDPSSETPSGDVMLEQSKKNRKKRRASLIDKALKSQQHEQAQELNSDAQRKMDPIYIRVSDLAADWSRYIVKPITMSSRDSASTTMPAQDAESRAAMPAFPKKNRKKSLIDKAASRQHRESLLSKLQDTTPIKPQTQAYCSLCEGMNRACMLCGH
jgi:hypothetical protein